MLNGSPSAPAVILADVEIYGELLDVILQCLIQVAPRPSFFLRYVIRGFDLNVQYTEETKENIF